MTMAVQNVEIIFDCPTAVFTPGQTITGRVLVANSVSMKIKSIEFIVKGKAKVSWTERRFRNDGGESLSGDGYSIEYHAEEKYFENKITLVGGGGESQLEAAVHIYPFSVSLPLQLPSTFEGEHGNVSYVAKVTISIPSGNKKILKKEKEVMLNVVSPKNLNYEPSLAKPVKVEKEKINYSCCCSSGPMTLVACVPYTGFVPGQTIPLIIELDNNSNVAITAVKIILKRELTFKARHPTKKIKPISSELALLRLQGIEARASKTWMEQITVPNSLTFYNLQHCGIIVDNYLLKVEAISGGMNGTTALNVKITMGNIPLTVSQNTTQIG